MTARHPEVEAPPARMDGPASDVVGARLSRQVDRVRRLDPLVRADAPDAVHRMRVALRRLRSALASYRPFLDRDLTDPVRDELKWLGQVLGPERDTEVMHQRLIQMVSAEDGQNLIGPVRGRIDREIAERQRTALDQRRQAMESPRYHALVGRLGELAAAPPFTEAAGEPAGDVLPPRVHREWKRLRRRVEAVEASSHPDERAALMHEARKAAKRARHAAEPVVALYGKPARRYAKAVKRVQSVLGEHHDSVVTQQELRRLADRAAADGDNAFTYGVLCAREQVRAASLETRFRKVWSAASAKKLRRWMS
ncbi:MAG: CHAD domain-containing protein [Nocardioidaceae bacterium]